MQRNSKNSRHKQVKGNYWIRRFNETNSLEDKPRTGRPTVLTKEKLEEIKNRIRNKINEDKKAGITTKEFLQIIEKETKRKYSLMHAQRLLHKIGLSLITPRVSHIRKDEKSQNEFRVQFKKKYTKNIWDME